MYNMIDQTAVIYKGAQLGRGNKIGPFCVVYGNAIIGNNNTFQSHVSIGSPAEKSGYFSPPPGSPGTVIGDDNIIREFVTINRGSRRPTKMGDGCLMLRGSHLSHDTILEDNVIVSCACLIGGESHIMTGANLALGSLLHQFSVVGSYAMVGMGAICTKTSVISPGKIYVGGPAKFLKENTVGLERNGITPELLEAEVERWKQIRDTNSK